MFSGDARAIRFSVSSIHCAHCTHSIKTLLQAYRHYFTVVDADPTTKTCVAYVDPQCSLTDNVLFEIIQQALSGVFEASDIKRFNAPETSPTTLLANRSAFWSLLIKGAIGTVIGLAWLVLMALGGVAVLSPVVIALLAGVTSGLVLYLGWPIYRSAWFMFIKTRRFNMDALFTVSTLTALMVSIAALFVPWLSMMFDAALLILGFRQLGLALEESAKKKLLTGLSFQERVSPEERVEKCFASNQTQWVPIDTLVKNDVIVVPAGSFIPVDGHLDVSSSLDAKLLTTIYDGHPHPVTVKAEQVVYSGMRVAEGTAIRMVVDAPYRQSYLVRADRAIEALRHNRAPLEEIADNILRYFVPIVFGIAMIAGVMIGYFFSPILAMQCIVATLVSACPCILGFIVPLAIKIGLSKGQSHQAFFSGGKPLQAAATVDAVMFDLHGTLTTGMKTVHQLSLYADETMLTEAQIVTILYRLEKNITKQAVASAIVHYVKQYAATHAVVLPEIQDAITIEPQGVCGVIDGVEYCLGDANMMKKHHLALPTLHTDRPSDQTVYLARGGQVIALIGLADPLREDAAAVVKSLQQSGKAVYICTGSDRVTACDYAEKLGITADHVYGNCLPFQQTNLDNQTTIQNQTKISVLEALQKKHRQIAFVGDSGNDAVVMEKNCLGIAMRSSISDDMTEKNAGIVIRGHLLRPLLAAFEISKQTVRNIKISLAVSLTYNALTLLAASGLLLAVGVALNPAVGVLLMIAQVCLLLGIAYYFQKKSLTVCMPPVLSTQKVFEQLPVSYAATPLAKQTVRLLVAAEQTETPTDSCQPPPSFVKPDTLCTRLSPF